MHWPAKSAEGLGYPGPSESDCNNQDKRQVETNKKKKMEMKWVAAAVARAPMHRPAQSAKGPGLPRALRARMLGQAVQSHGQHAV